MKHSSLKVGKVLTPTEEHEKVVIAAEEGKIAEISSWDDSTAGKNVLDFSNDIAVPGLIDIHIHGYAGCDSTSGNSDDLLKIARRLPENGVTTFLPTTMSESRDTLLKAANAFREAKQKSEKGAKMPGMHLEGPHFGTGKEKGAQNPEVLREPDVDEFEDLYEAAGGKIERVTLAPELSGASEYIKEAKERGITAAAGHTAASCDEAVEGFDAGITICNHLYNGMKGFHHRNPGVIGACLTRDDVYAEMIADMIHLHPAAIDMAVRAKGVEKTVLITDSISATGLPDGEYELGGQKVVVEGGICRVKETGRLAGSTLTMDKAVKNINAELDFSLRDGIRMATLNPARALKLSNRGRIAPGFAADMTVLNSELDVVATIVGGEVLYPD